MAPELEKLIQDAKEILQKIAEHPDADCVVDFVIHIIDDLRVVYQEIEEDSKGEKMHGFAPLHPLTTYPASLLLERR